MAKLILTKSFVSSVTCPNGKAKADFFDAQCRGLLTPIQY